MMILPLAKISILMHIVMWLWILVALGLVLIVLMQKGRGGGVGAAFGGMGASSLMGSKTGDFFTWVTVGLVALFLLLAIFMGKFLKPQDENLLGPMEPPAGQINQQAQEQDSAEPATGQDVPAEPGNPPEEIPVDSQEVTGQAEEMNEQPAPETVPEPTK